MTTADATLPGRMKTTADYAADYRAALREKQLKTLLGVIVALVMAVVAAHGSEVDLRNFFNNIWRFPKYLYDILPVLRINTLWADIAEWYWGFIPWGRLLWDTILIAYAGTLLGAIGGFFLSFMAARNLTMRAADEFSGGWPYRLKGAGVALVALVALLVVGRLMPSLAVTLNSAIGVIGFGIGAIVDITRLVLTIAAFFAILWFLLGTRILARRTLEFMRTVPELVFALIFVVAFGLGPLPGVLAIAIHTMGALGKLFAEVVENVDMKPADGAYASGASWWQMVRYAIVPQVIPGFVSYTLLRFEINVRGASIMGFVGAGGIGQDLIEAIRKFFFSDVSAILLMIIVTVMIIDWLTEKLRYRFLAEVTR